MVVKRLELQTEQMTQIAIPVSYLECAAYEVKQQPSLPQVSHFLYSQVQVLTCKIALCHSMVLVLVTFEP